MLNLFFISIEHSDDYCDCIGWFLDHGFPAKEVTFSTGIEDHCTNGKCTNPEMHVEGGHDI